MYDEPYVIAWCDSREEAEVIMDRERDKGRRVWVNSTRGLQNIRQDAQGQWELYWEIPKRWVVCGEAPTHLDPIPYFIVGGSVIVSLLITWAYFANV